MNFWGRKGGKTASLEYQHGSRMEDIAKHAKVMATTEREAVTKALRELGVVFKEDSVASREAMDRDSQQNRGYLKGGSVPPSGNGAQCGFATGATRSTDEGKIDFEGHINPEVLAIFGDYMNRHRVQRDGRVRASDNWQAGIPIYRYVKSFIRHGLEFWRMWRGIPVRNPDSDELFTFRDVLCALTFNVMGLIYEIDKAHELDNQYVTPDLRRKLESVDQLKAGEPGTISQFIPPAYDPDQKCRTKWDGWTRTRERGHFGPHDASGFKEWS